MQLNQSCVYLVGAGPGDPELLTLKAIRLIEAADVVVYDRLVSPEIMDLVPQGTQRIYVGKARGAHHFSQDDINRLLATLARSKRCVVRLKGGDPFIFGRGGEEAAFLTDQGIGVQVVPGITAAASATYAGIPLTHRGLANSVTYVTGHCRGDAPLSLDWRGLAGPDTTLVLYMALHHLEEISARLISAGRSPDTPAALIERGTTSRQRSHVTTLAELARNASSNGFESPTVVIVGRVVEMVQHLPAQRSLVHCSGGRHRQTREVCNG